MHESLQKTRVEEVDIPSVGEEKSSTDIDSRSMRAKQRHSGENLLAEELDQEDSEGFGTSQPSPQLSAQTTHFLQPFDSKVMRDGNDAKKIDFCLLCPELKEQLSNQEGIKMMNKFDDKLQKLVLVIDRMTPNMKVCCN